MRPGFQEKCINFYAILNLLVGYRITFWIDNMMQPVYIDFAASKILYFKKGLVWGYLLKKTKTLRFWRLAKIITFLITKLLVCIYIYIYIHVFALYLQFDIHSSCIESYTYKIQNTISIYGIEKAFQFTLYSKYLF
jgi:hypothetical protein